MKTFPKCKQLLISMYCCSVFGCFPAKLMFKGHDSLQKAYSRYGNVMLAYYSWLTFSIYLELVQMLQTNLSSMDVISGILSIGLINTATVFRQLTMRFHPNFTKLVQKVVDLEHAIWCNRIPEVVEAYDSFVDKYNKNCKLYLYIMIVLTLNFFIRPLVVEPFEIQVENQTLLIKTIPLPCWMPFDKQKHYNLAYSWGAVNAIIGASYVAITDVFMCTLIAHPMGLLTVLRKVLINFEKQAQICQTDELLNNEDAEFYTFTCVIKWHNQIIDFIGEYNNVMSGVMLFDFLQSSMQVAFIVVQILESGITLMILSYVLFFIITMLFRLILYYHYANEVTYLNESLAYEIWDVRWFEKPPRVKYMMRMFIMRCQKSLTYNIGPFGTLSMAALLSLLRTTYSYVMLLKGFSIQ